MEEQTREPTEAEAKAMKKRRLSAEPLFTWECTKFDSKGLGFKMGFKNPLEVSKSNSKPDKLVLQLKKNTFFAAGTGEPLTGKLSLQLEIPKQFPNSWGKALTEAISDSASTILNVQAAVGVTGAIFFA